MASSSSPSLLQSIGPDAHAAVAPARERTIWVDSAKGIGIILVIVGHVIGGLREAGLPRSTLLDRVVHVIYTFHMPLFFVLSGLMIERTLKKPFPLILREKIARLAYPYFLWSIIYATLNVVMARYTNRDPRLLEIILGLPFRPYAHFWFIRTLFLVTVTYVAFAKLRVPNYLLFALAIPAWFYDLAGGGAFFGYLVWLTFGALMRRNHYFQAMAVMGVVLLGWSGIYALLGIATVACISVAFYKKQSVMSWLGGLSFEIYLAHIFGTAGTRIVLLRVLHVQSLPIHFVCGVLAGILVPVVMVETVRRFKVRYVFGFP